MRVEPSARYRSTRESENGVLPRPKRNRSSHRKRSATRKNEKPESLSNCYAPNALNAQAHSITTEHHSDNGSHPKSNRTIPVSYRLQQRRQRPCRRGARAKALATVDSASHATSYESDGAPFPHSLHIHRERRVLSPDPLATAPPFRPARAFPAPGRCETPGA